MTLDGETRLAIAACPSIMKMASFHEIAPGTRNGDKSGAAGKRDPDFFKRWKSSPPVLRANGFLAGAVIVLIR